MKVKLLTLFLALAAITVSGGAVCWGANGAGQLGNNSNAPFSPVPAPVLTVAPEPIKAPLARAAEVDLVPKPSPALAQETPTAPAETRADKPPLSQRIFEFVSAQWRWLLVLLLAPLALLGWAWRAHHLAYDKNGLPRGPRL